MRNKPVHSFPVAFWALAACLSACLGFGGCAEAEPRVVLVYCNGTYLPLLEDLADLYGKAFGIVVRCVPIDEEPAIPEKTTTPSPSREDSREDSGNENESRSPSSATQNHEIPRGFAHDFAQSFLDHPKGDLYLCDTPEEVRRLREEEALLDEPKTIAYLRPVLIVAKGNPHRFDSVRDVLESGEPLGVLSENPDSLARRSHEYLRRLRERFPALSESERVVTFPSRALLLQALENEELEAAIVWDQTARRLADRVVSIAISPGEAPATALSMLTLSSSESPQAAKLFTVFAASEQGRAVLEKHGYTVDGTDQP